MHESGSDAREQLDGRSSSNVHSLVARQLCTRCCNTKIMKFVSALTLRWVPVLQGNSGPNTGGTAARSELGARHAGAWWQGEQVLCYVHQESSVVC